MRYLFLELHFLFTALIFCSCGYQEDRLKVINESNKSICYETVVFDPQEQRFYLAPAGDSVPVGQNKSPVVKSSVRYKIEQKEYDGFLYMCFFSCDKSQDFWTNTDSFIKNIDTSEVRMYKFSKLQLDSMDWKITYKD